MSEHVHEWTWAPYWEDGPDRRLFVCIVKGCDAEMSMVEVECRLNATEQLNNQDASFLSGFALHYATDHPEGIGMWTVENIVELGEKAASYAIELEKT